MRHSIRMVADPPHARKAASVNVLPREQQLHALHLLVEGVSLRSVTRLTRVHRATVTNLMLRTAGRLARLLAVGAVADDHRDPGRLQLRDFGGVDLAADQGLVVELADPRLSSSCSRTAASIASP